MPRLSIKKLLCIQIRAPLSAPPDTADEALSADLATYAPLVRRIAENLARRLPSHVGAAVLDDLSSAGMAALFDVLRRGRLGPQTEGFGFYLRVRLRGAMLDDLRKRDFLPRRTRKRGETTTEGVTRTVVSLEELSVGRERAAVSLVQDNPYDQAEARATRARLLRAVAGLPDRERLIITMHYLEGVRFKEIGSLLGVSEPRISQLHSRAMDALREQFRHDGEPRSGVRIRARAALAV